MEVKFTLSRAAIERHFIDTGEMLKSGQSIDVDPTTLTPDQRALILHPPPAYALEVEDTSLDTVLDKIRRVREAERLLSEQIKAKYLERIDRVLTVYADWQAKPGYLGFSSPLVELHKPAGSAQMAPLSAEEKAREAEALRAVRHYATWNKEQDEALEDARERKVREREEQLRTGADHVTLTITDGVLRAPIYEPHRRGSNWIATVTPNLAQPSGMDRAFWKRVADDRYLVPEDLRVGDAIECGADYHSAGGRKNPARWYGRVVARDETSVEVAVFGSAADMFAAAQTAAAV